MDWSPLAGSDPVPGDPERVEELGRHYLRVAWAIRDCEAKLRRIVDHPDMQSEAVAAFRDTGREVAEDIGRAFERYDGVGRALIGYAPVQRDAQFESAAALHQAKDAEAELASASRLVDAAQSRVNAAAAAGADTTVELGDYRRAVAAADAAGEALAAARRRLAGAVEDRDRAAGRAMGLVQEVRDSGDLNDTWWDNWGAKVVKVIVKIADWVATIAGVLALVLAWVPILGQFLAAVALGRVSQGSG